MNFEVLLSCMNENKSIVNRTNINSNIIVVNQIDQRKEYSEESFEINEFRCKWYNVPEKGLSNSRNFALNVCQSDIVILCDDDVTYIDDYAKIIIRAFQTNPNADVIIFDFDYDSVITDQSYNVLNDIDFKRLSIYNMLKYGSVRIAFKVKEVTNLNISFDTRFGSGSVYSHGEDSIFLSDCWKNGLKIYKTNLFLGRVNTSESSWFNGYTLKYYFDKGAVFARIFNPFIAFFVSVLHVIRHPEEKADFHSLKKIFMMIKGIIGYIRKIDFKAISK